MSLTTNININIDYKFKIKMIKNYFITSNLELLTYNISIKY